jgi:tetratricopeptide (TPR) repeat protein
MQVKRGYTLTEADRQTLTTTSEGNPEAALRRGYALHTEGDYAGAIIQFDAAIAGFTSPHANALANRALAYLALNNLEKARADIAAGDAADPDDTILFHAKGRLAEIEKDDLEAVLAFTGALRSWPANTHALYRRAAAYERMGQSARALADLERIATLQPQDNGAKTALATQLLSMGRVEQAYAQVDLVARSIGYPNAKVQMFIGMAQSLASSLKESDPAKAEVVLTNALSVETDFPALLIDRARIRELQGDSRGAAADMAHFKYLTRINLDDPVQACVSQTLLRHSRDAALDMCEKAIERKGNDAELHMRRGYLLYVLSRASEAVDAYRTATDLDPSNQKAKYGLGKMLKDAGRAAEGEALMAAALSSDPKANEDYDMPLHEVRVSG